jgi:uncharacterized protein Usg
LLDATTYDWVPAGNCPRICGIGRSSALGARPMEDVMSCEHFRRQLEGYGLTTAEIVYRRPDHPWLLQSYIWQEYDLFPDFPHLKRFLVFWKNNLEGRLHSVAVGHSRLFGPAQIRSIDGEFRLH